MPLVRAPYPGAIPLQVIAPAALDGWLDAQDAATRAWVRASGHEAAAGEVLCLPAPDGSIAGALLGWGDPGHRRERFQMAGAAAKLPAATYRLRPVGVELDAGLETLGWVMGAYRFDRYRAVKPRRVSLVCPEDVDAARIERIAGAARLAQDLINTPARDMGPEALEAAFMALAAC